MTEASPARYRHEGGKTCIDVRLRALAQLFDGRDPAPFRARDLDPAAIDYLIGATEELPPKTPLKIVFWLPEAEPFELPPPVVVDAVRAHFTSEVSVLTRKIRSHLRYGQIALVIGLGALTLFLTLARLSALLLTEPVREILREGFVIMGWVALWRPLDVLLYEWWPIVRDRRLRQRIADAEIVLARGVPPGGLI